MEFFLSPFVLVLSPSWDMSCPRTVLGQMNYINITLNLRIPKEY